MTVGTRHGEPLSAALEAAYETCLSCNACRSVCPVQGATNRLAPLKLLRLAALGMADALLSSAELWYCLQCNACSSTCPMSVKPSVLIRRLRTEAVARGLVPEDMFEALEALGARFQRVRWHMIASGAEGTRLEEMAREWRRWSEQPIQPLGGNAPLRPTADAGQLEACLGFSTDFGACMTCGACSTTCPIAHDRSVYDPVAFFRLMNLGQQEALLASPSLWLCIGCQACTDACTQQVAGHLVLRGLQRLSVRQGKSPADMQARLWTVEHALLPEYLREVDALLEARGGSDDSASSRG